MATRRGKPKFTGQQVSNAAVVLGIRSWLVRLERFGLPTLREQLSSAGKLGGRPKKQEPQEVQAE